MKGLFTGILFFLALPTSLSAQTINEPDTALVERTHEAFEELIHMDKDSAQIHLQLLKSLSAKTKRPRTQFLYAYDLGYYYFIQHKLDSASQFFQNSLDIAKGNGLKKEMVYAKIWVANLRYFENNYNKAGTMYQEVIEESTAIGYIDGIANGYFGLASLEKDAEKILVLHLKIDSLYKAHNAYSPILSNSLGVVGKTYLQSNFIENAKEYFEKSFEIARKTNYIPGLSHANEILGEIALKQNSFKEAEDYFNKALSEAIELQDTIFMARGLTNLAEIDLKRNDFKGAADRLLLAEKYARLFNDSISLTGINLQLANCYLGLNKINRARHHLNYVENHPKYLSKDDYLMALYTTSIQYHETQRDYAAAFELQKKLEQLKIEIEKRRNNIAFVEFERKNTLEQNQKQIALLHSEKEVMEERRKNQRNLLLGGIGMTSLAGLFLFLLFRNRQKTTKKLRELDHLKSKFFANISHEFRTPLTLISGPLEKRLEVKKLSKTDQKDFEMMQRNAKRLLNLVNQLLDLSKLEVGKYQLHIAQGNLGVFLKTLAESFAYIAEQKNIHYTVEIDGLEDVWYDQEAIEKVIVNLLSNAFKYTKKGGKVRLIAQNVSNDLILRLSNTPTEIASGTIENLFDRFYQADPQTDGVGIGLSLVWELVQLHKGTIKVNQPALNALEFTISLPLTKEAHKSESLFDKHPETAQIPVVSHADSLEGKQDEIEFITENDTNILLVVEDNADVRKFIKEIFENNYQVVLAGDGHEGMVKALKYVPDLIISDIMMPRTNGLELCEQLKGDERTSHIPIILLTAKADEEHQYEGLSQGADAFVTKPFKSKLLRTRVAKLIASRKALRDRYSQEVILKPKDIAITNVDVQFLDRVQGILDSKLTESAFSIEDFSNAVGMSCMQLHRKLKALTGLSASEFVRSQRLKLAASLLEQSDINVSQVAYQVGFNDPSYFTKCFKEAYDMSPTQYSQRTS